MCQLSQLFSDLKKYVQDHEVYPWHTIEELTETVQHIEYILHGSGWHLEPENLELLHNAHTIIKSIKEN